MPTIILDKPDCEKLAFVNQLLTELTEAHHVCCHCELCVMRMMSDSQDPESFVILDVVLDDVSEGGAM